MKKHDMTDWHYESKHFMDVRRNKGYEYHNHLLQKVVSPEITSNPLLDVPYRQIERLMEHLIDEVKRIKLVFAIAYDKNERRNIN